MSDFQSFIADRLNEVDYKDPRTSVFIKQATIRQLRELSAMPVDFLDGSFSIVTSPGQDNYGPGDYGFPADLFAFVGDPYVSYIGGPLISNQPIKGPVPIGSIRAGELLGRTSLFPEKWAWHNGFMWIWPGPQASVTISADYRRNGTVDAATGITIHDKSTTATNGWFNEGENVLRCAVLAEWFMSIAGDPNKAQMYTAQIAEYKKNLRSARGAKRIQILQAADRFFGDGSED